MFGLDEEGWESIWWSRHDLVLFFLARLLFDLSLFFWSFFF